MNEEFKNVLFLLCGLASLREVSFSNLIMLERSEASKKERSFVPQDDKRQIKN
ncbi:hypothetical protein GGR21_003073 [Dysgonomonas hofstadii]|uniref:Uncharacterized protein n=1 Tax=Dysgonomonas hofstadii TaxID=637886 RepID=A0A840CSQ3_9BACT|nr:hypothetical protein [Dysgonomonas hofstadii]